MTKIKLLTSLAGEAFVHKPGAVIEVDDAEALRHYKNGNAEPYVEPAPAPVIPPVVPPVENATLDQGDAEQAANTAKGKAAKPAGK